MGVGAAALGVDGGGGVPGPASIPPSVMPSDPISDALNYPSGFAPKEPSPAAKLLGATARKVASEHRARAQMRFRGLDADIESLRSLPRATKVRMQIARNAVDAANADSLVKMFRRATGWHVSEDWEML